MQSINALSLAPDVIHWLATSRHPRVLHVFDHACNLINERWEVLSIVTPQIGNGPFNLVVEVELLFYEHLNIESSILIFDDQLQLANLTISTNNASLWSPLPNWEMLHANRVHIFGGLKSCLSSWKSAESDSIAGLHPELSITNNQFYNSLSSALATADLSSSLTVVQKLAGLGIGLTPAGDDFILGAVLAAWIIHPPEIARVLAELITITAAPLTTSLSAAWLRSTGRGEAGILWHNFFATLIFDDPNHIQESMDRILAVGETSGTDALQGFMGTLARWAELAGSEIH